MITEKKHMIWENNRNKKLRIGIIGAGYAAAVHSKVLKKIDPSIIQYVYDVKAESSKTFERENGCHAVENLDNFYHCVDAVIIATPVSTHHELVLESLKRDKHILCEKPMAMYVSEVLEMYQMSLKKKLVCAIGFNYRFFEITKYIKREIEIGNFLQIDISIKRLFRNDWKKDETSVLSDLGIHLIDLLMYLSAHRISLKSCEVHMKCINTCDVYSVVCGKMDDGASFTLTAARIEDPDDVSFYIQIVGQNGTFQYDSRKETTYVVKNDHSMQEYHFQKAVETDDFFDFSDSILRQDQEWIEAILGKTAVKVANFEDGLHSQMALESFFAKRCVL